MSAYNYVDSPNSNLTCCICRHPFVEPVTTTCSHTFCYECILGALSHAHQCPIDRSPLTPKELGPADSIIRALVDELVVQCVHREEGCKHVCQRQRLPTHLREECSYIEVLCSEADCTERMPRKDIDIHMEDKHKGRPMDEASFGEKRKGELTSESQKCPQSNNGCSFSTVDTEVLSNHITSCPYYGLKEYFTVSAVRYASILEQNVLLRHRVSALEASVQILRREMEAVRRALGPWFRVESSGTTYLNAQPSHRARPATVDRQNATSNSPTLEELNQSELAAASPAASTRDVPGTTETLASYFLSTGAGTVGQQISDASARGHHRVTVSPSALGHMNHETYPMFGHHPVRTPIVPHLAPQASASWAIPGSGDIVAVPQLSSMIAPLDLGSTLEGTLTGLRDSTLTLAAGVDSLGRRSEIAVTNESLRFGEEIMSLRASIHGLRMQVHTMMMERNAQITGSTLSTTKL